MPWDDEVVDKWNLLPLRLPSGTRLRFQTCIKKAIVTDTILVLAATGETGRRQLPELAARGARVRAASRRHGVGLTLLDWDRPVALVVAVVVFGASMAVMFDGAPSDPWFASASRAGSSSWPTPHG